MKTLTFKQQVKVCTTVFRLLAAIGFQFDTRGGFWWYPIAGRNLRICVGRNVLNMLCQKRFDCWSWQKSALNEPPAFGYSGTTTSGTEFCPVKKVIDITLEQIYYAGLSHGLSLNRDQMISQTNNVKKALAELLQTLP